MDTNPLPVLKTAWAAACSPFEHAGDFVRLGWAPGVLMFAAQAAAAELATLLDRPLLAFAYWLPYPVITIPLAVAWTRLVFIGPEQQTTWPPFRFGRREFAYLATSIGLGLGLFSLSAIAGIVTYLFWARSWSLYALLLAVILLAAGFYAAVRLTFVLPSVAVDKFQGIATAWRQTRGAVWRIAGITGVASLPINLLGSIGSTIAGYILPWSATPAEIVVQLLTLTVTTAAIALIYKEIIKPIAI